MCLEFSGESSKEDDEMHEVGAYKTYITLKHSIKPWLTKNAIVYNEVMEEFNYCDNEGRLWPLKLFTSHPLDDTISLESSPPSP